MSNKIKNRLIIIGYDEQVEQVKMFLEGEPDENNKERIIDFNNIVEMPLELDVECKFYDITYSFPFVYSENLLPVK